MCGSRPMVDIQSATAEIRRGKKIEDRRQKEDRNIMAYLIINYIIARGSSKSITYSLFVSDDPVNLTVLDSDFFDFVRARDADYNVFNYVIILLEARLQPNIANTLRRVLMLFTRSDITLPKANRFG